MRLMQALHTVLPLVRATMEDVLTTSGVGWRSMIALGVTLHLVAMQSATTPLMVCHTNREVPTYMYMSKLPFHS